MDNKKNLLTVLFAILFLNMLGFSAFLLFKCRTLEEEMQSHKILLERALESEQGKIDSREYLVEKICLDHMNKKDSLFFNELRNKIYIKQKELSSLQDEKVETRLSKAIEINDSISKWFYTFSYCGPNKISELFFFNPMPKEYVEGEKVTFNFFVTYFKETYFSGNFMYEGSSDSSVSENGENTFRYTMKVPMLKQNEKRKPFKKLIKLYYKNPEINKRDSILCLLKFDIVPKNLKALTIAKK